MRIVSDALQLQVFVNVKIVAVRSFLKLFTLEKVFCSTENASVGVLQNLWSLDNVTWCYLSYNLTPVFPDFRIVSSSCITTELEKSLAIGRRSITSESMKSELVLFFSKYCSWEIIKIPDSKNWIWFRHWWTLDLCEKSTVVSRRIPVG